MPPFDDVTARGGGSVDLTGHELLVVNRDGPNPESYKKGDIVIVRPYLWPWGTEEDPETRTQSPTDKFVILRAPNADFSAHRFLGAPQVDESVDPPETVAKSRYRVDLANLPSAVQTSLDDNGKADISYQSASTPHIKDKKDGSGVNDIGAL